MVLLLVLHPVCFDSNQQAEVYVAQRHGCKACRSRLHSAILWQMRAATIWLCLAALWAIDAGFAFRRHDLRQGFVAGMVAICFLAAGLYFASRRPGRRH
jgi:hypothetical protein